MLPKFKAGEILKFRYEAAVGGRQEEGTENDPGRWLILELLEGHEGKWYTYNLLHLNTGEVSQATAWYIDRNYTQH